MFSLVRLPRAESSLASQRAVCDLPHPVRTAETAITGTFEASIVL